jgi:hypothetical protein
MCRRIDSPTNNLDYLHSVTEPQATNYITTSIVVTVLFSTRLSAGLGTYIPDLLSYSHTFEDTYDMIPLRIRWPVSSTFGITRVLLTYLPPQLLEISNTHMYVDGSNVGVSLTPINDRTERHLSHYCIGPMHVIVIICFHTYRAPPHQGDYLITL